MSMATQQYLRKHRLLGNAQPLPVAQTVGSNVLDIQRLKALPKLM